jgi:hypothetical protein
MNMGIWLHRVTRNNCGSYSIEHYCSYHNHKAHKPQHRHNTVIHFSRFSRSLRDTNGLLCEFRSLLCYVFDMHINTNTNRALT